MLEFFREKIQGTFATVLVLFFCAVFALWGVEQLFTGGGKPKAVATVNGEDITEAELANAIEMMRRQYTQMLGGKVDPNFLNDKVLREPALESLISRRLLEGYARENGMAMSPVDVEKAIVADKTFSQDGKTFDPEFFKQRLRQAGLTPIAYQQSLGQQMMLQQLQQGITASAFVTDAEVRERARLNGQKRAFEFIRFPLQQFVDAAVVSEEAIAQHYQAHQSEFMTEEQVVVEYLEVSKPALAAAIQVAENEIREAYDKEAAEFKSVSERKASHILIEESKDGSHEKKLAEIRQKLAAGEAFESLAKAYSVDEGSAAQGGDVGYTTGQTFVEEFEKALAALANVGDVSEPVKTEFGYHLIKLTDKRDTRMKPFEERRAELEKSLRDSRAAVQYGEKVDALGEATYSAGDLSGPSTELGLPVQKSAPFSRRGGPGVAADQKVIEAAFSPDLIESGKNSEAIELAGGERTVVIRVTEHLLPKARDLNEVRPGIVSTLKREIAEKQLDEQLAGLKDRAEKEQSLEGISKDTKLPVHRVQAGTRQGGQGENADIYEQAFAVRRPAEGVTLANAGKLPSGDGFVLRLTGVEDVPVDEKSQEYAQLKEEMRTEAAQREFDAFERGLRASAKIVRYDQPQVDAPASP